MSDPHQNRESQKYDNPIPSREYSAIVYGHMISGGTVDKPIGRDAKDRIKQAVNEDGKDAITHVTL
jgi:23S rRNA pseudouridine1911/1915/1917 synthase